MCGPNQLATDSSDLQQIIDQDEDDDEGAQYAMPMDDPYAEVEQGWRRMSEASTSDSFASPPRHLSEHNGQWRPLPSSQNDEVVDQLSGFSFVNPRCSPNQPVIKQASASRKFSLPATLSGQTQPAPMNLSMRRSDQPNLFRPPSSSVPTKSSFTLSDLVIKQSLTNRPRISSFSTELEPISGSPTSPDSPMNFPSTTTLHHHQSTQFFNSVPLRHSRSSLPNTHHSGSGLASKSRPEIPNGFAPPAPSSSSSSSFCSSSDGCLLRRASCSSLASVASMGSSTNGSTSGLKARRGLTKPLSLAMPPPLIPGPCTSVTTSVPPRARRHLQPSSSDVQSAAFRSLPPSPRLSTADHGQMRDQIVGMKANVTGGLSMKRRTSIPRLSLGGISATTPLVDPHRRASFAVNGSNDYVRLLGRNLERPSVHVAPTPLRLHFDPVAAEAGKKELLSSQVGVGGKGHIERPEPGLNGEPVEEFPYQNGPREVLPGLFLGSEQNARDPDLLRRLGFGCIVNVAKEVNCPWTLPAPSQVVTPTPVDSSVKELGAVQNHHPSHLATPPRLQLPNANSSPGRTFLVRPTASTPNLHRSFKSPESRTLNKQSDNVSSSFMTGPTSNCKSDLGAITVEFSADEQTGRPALEYRKLPWSHDEDGLAAGAFDGIFEAIDRALDSGRRTLVHCQCGVSRSATLVIGYVMRRSALEGGRGGMHEAYTFVKDKSPWAGPNMGLIYQLIEYEKVLKKSSKLTVVPGVQEEEEEEGVRTPTGGGESD
ncbi:hypothetical protein CROQUDRAFT_41508 [Cronartium quercuum f. sp. fusiforme G11]|uniref:protein-tyrosine-phosphatase n=1 Tax=Cronartium quercuum f. sp. fusiforme G11 TaxID=708437 RepID=A0A9P6NQD6_9BASI|nr:hypothetical protein CROQUDRAFT_41508 [Cronartium quercuum f. sp. fusiforme G11]